MINNSGPCSQTYTLLHSSLCGNLAETLTSVFLFRYTIKGIQNLIFYGLPSFPHFYSEVCNMLAAGSQGEEASWTCTALYSRYDAHKLAAITGAQRAGQMLHSNKTVHLFITGGEDK